VFVLVRFVFRLALWWMVLRKTSSLDLELNATHPDGAGT